MLMFDKIVMLLNRLDMLMKRRMGLDIDFSLYRTQRYKTIFSWVFMITLLLLIALSVLMVFSFPSFIKPKSSVGMMNVLTLVLCVMSVPSLLRKIKQTNLYYGSLMDVLVIVFYIANLVSLLNAPRTQDMTPFRLLSSGILIYFSLRLWEPDQNQKIFFIHCLGLLTVIIASVSILQGLFPSLLNSVAERYFGGRSAYGLDLEFERGRLLHWGSIILTFPFYWVSILLLKPINSFKKYAYILLGTSMVLLAFIMSNFRWTVMVFLIISILFAKVLYYFNFLSKKSIVRIILLSLIVTFVGLYLAKSLLGYNLVERFLLVNKVRDIDDTLGRTMLFNQALNVFFSSPLIGVGTGNYYSLVSPFQHLSYFSIFDQFKLLLVPVASHNELLTILAETGVMGFLSWLLIMYVAVKKMILFIINSCIFSTVDTLLLFASALSFGSYILYTLFENIFPQNIIYIVVLIGICDTWIKPKHTNFSQ